MHRFIFAPLLGILLAALSGHITHADELAAAPNWPDSYFTRLEALALLQTLNAELLSHDSATETLTHWCATHRLTDDPHIIAVRSHAAPKPPSDGIRQLLQVTPQEPIRHRHVQLKCGDLVLSEADNWYVPGRLSQAMNQQLDSTDTPFGVVVRDTHFQRHTLSAQLLWMPLPSGWEMSPSPASGTAAHLAVPAAVLEHHAVLSLADGTPFSALIEIYTGNVLAFPLPALPH